MVKLTDTNQKQEAQGLYAELFSFLCILNVVVIFIIVQLLWLLHSIGPSP